MPTTPRPVELHTDRRAAARAARAGRSGLLGGAGLLTACALVCCLPLLTAAGAAVGLGTLTTGAWAAGAGILAATAVAGTIALRRRRKHAHGDPGSCADGCTC
jgi:hypothetical protein